MKGEEAELEDLEDWHFRLGGVNVETNREEIWNRKKDVGNTRSRKKR